MASKGLRAIPYQITRIVETGCNPSHTTETLIGYTACCVHVHLVFLILTTLLLYVLLFENHCENYNAESLLLLIHFYKFNVLR